MNAAMLGDCNHHSRPSWVPFAVRNQPLRPS
jgi:hypothetical protein